MEANNATQTFLGDEQKRSAARIELYDVQGLWGGRKITVEHGRAVVQVIGRGMVERRFEFDLSPDDWSRLLDVVIQHDFVTIQPADRPGIPDEGRPTITLVNATGEKRAVAKWAGVKDERFDAVYAALIQLEQITKTLEPVSSGPFTP